MICPTCKDSLRRKLKKNELFDCRCGSKILVVEISKKLILVDVTNDKGEK